MTLHHPLTGVTPVPTSPSICRAATSQGCSTAATEGKSSSAAVMDSDCMHHYMIDEKSCDLSHDSSEPENEIFFTPPISPVSPQYCDKGLVSHNICSQKTIIKFYS